MNRDARARGAEDPEVRAEACARAIAAADDIAALIAGVPEADFFDATTVEARSRRAACEAYLVRIANDVAEANIEDDLPKHVRGGLKKQRSIAAHAYAAMREDMLWIALNEMGVVRAAAVAALAKLENDEAPAE